MSKYQRFVHPTKGEERVKIGFSWTGFFFTIFWLGISGIWRWFWVWMVYLLVSSFCIVFYEESRSTGGASPLASFLIFLASWGFNFGPGIWGNRWKAASLIRRGYAVSDKEWNPEHRSLVGRELDMSSSGQSPQILERVPCPYCAEDIKPAAVLCRFCKSDLEPGWSAVAREVGSIGRTVDVVGSPADSIDGVESKRSGTASSNVGSGDLVNVRTNVSAAAPIGAGSWIAFGIGILVVAAIVTAIIDFVSR